MRKHFILLVITIISLFMLIVIGAYVAAANFGEGCGPEWPTCNGGLLPQPTLEAVTEYLHRIFAALSALLLFITTAVFIRVLGIGSFSSRLLVLASLVMVLEILLGAIVVFNTIPPELVALHQGIALVVYALIVGAAFSSYRNESKMQVKE